MSIPGVIDFGELGAGTQLLADFDTSFLAVQVYVDAGTNAESVLKFGAVPNTGVDQTAALQAALDSGYSSIFLPPGVYNFTQLFLRENGLNFFGSGNSSVLNCTSTSVFSAICLVELYTSIQFHDIELRGAISSEPAGPSPLRGIVDGTNTAGTAHSTQVWNAFNRIYRVHITGAVPGTNGFNLGCQFNYSNYSTFEDCVVESLYGTTSNFGYGVVCNGKGQQLTKNRFLATIAGQGRHAIYMTNTPFDILCDGNYALNFQNEAYTSNTGGSTPGTFGYLKVLNNVAENCLQTGSGSSEQQAVIDITAPYSIISGNTVVGSAFSAFSCYNVEGCTFSDNIVNGCVGHGFWLNTCTNLKLHHNQVFNPDSAGTSTYGGIEIISCSGSEVDNNRIDGTNYRFGIRFNGTTPVPTNNQLFDNFITGSYSVDIENAYIDPSNTIRRPKSEARTIAYTAGATTIDVSQNVTLITGISNTGAVTITSLTGAVIGQQVQMLFFDTNETINRTNFKFEGSTNFTSTVDSSLTVLCTNIASGIPQWLETGRSTSVG